MLETENDVKLIPCWVQASQLLGGVNHPISVLTCNWKQTLQIVNSVQWLRTKDWMIKFSLASSAEDLNYIKWNIDVLKQSGFHCFSARLTRILLQSLLNEKPAMGSDSI